MDLFSDERPSDSPYVERIWCSYSEFGGPFISMAESHWEMVVTKLRGKVTLTVRGPETRATPAYAPDDGEFLGIQFKPGAFMPDLPPGQVMDRNDINLPGASEGSFWLKGSAWQFPDFENADNFIDRLVRQELLVFDPLIAAVMQGQTVDASVRTVQRRLRQATGLTQGTRSQIERARYATTLLKQGTSILDAIFLAGYADQPHLTRSLKHLIGQTPSQIIRQGRSERLSFLLKTEPF
jgi:AraC-like DNA-binding protein